jgi:hypothetical protein
LVPFLIALAVMAVPAAAQANVGPAQATVPAEHVAAGGGASDPARAERRGRRKRPGCRRFCQQAGGFGNGEEVNPPVEIPAQEVGGTRDRVVAIRATCNFDRDCVGAIILGNRRFEYGRADLEIPVGETRAVRVGISKEGKRYLEEKGPDEKAFATVPLIYDDAPVSVSGKLTLLAP